MKETISIIAMLFLVLALFFSGCTYGLYGPSVFVGGTKAISKYQHGDLVTLRLTGEQVQIVGICYQGWSHRRKEHNYSYYVRINAIQMKTNTHLFSPDGPIDIYAPSVIKVREYELEQQ